jgi:hypothetical protein
MGDVFRSIADDKSLALLNIIALSDPKGVSLGRKTHFSTREYYSRINKLANYGLIRRRHGGYYLTPLGRVVYATELKIGRAVNNFWQLKALDYFEEINEVKGNERDSHTNVVSSLIRDEKKKELFLTVDTNSSSDLNISPRIKPTSDFKRDLIESEVYDEFLSTE